MKTINVKAALLILTGLVLSTAMITSCSKSNNNTPKKPVGPSNPGGYSYSNQIQPTALATYWAFNGNLTDSGSGHLAITNNGATFGTGMISGTQAFQGSSTGYAVATNPGTALPALQSFTASVWINSAQVSGNEEAFFQIVDSTQWQSNLHLGLISNASSDTLTLGVKMQNWPGGAAIPWQTYYLNAYLDTAVGKWTNVVVTYNGASSTLNIYENGVLIPINGPYTSYPGYEGLELFQNDPGSGTTPNSNPNSATPWGNLTFKYATGLTFGAWSVNTTPPLSDNGTEPWAGNYLGQMEHLRIWNVALDATDVNSLYILEKAGF